MISIFPGIFKLTARLPGKPRTQMSAVVVSGALLKGFFGIFFDEISMRFGEVA